MFFPALLRGATVTMQVFFLSTIIFYLGSLIAALGKLAPYRAVRWIATIYIEIFRGTSLLVQLFWLFFVLPEFGIFLSPMVAGVLALGLNYAAYGSEVVRGAINGVQKGQWEASIALNLSNWKRMSRIIFPQAVSIMVPGMANLTIELMKATSVVSAVTLVDMTFASVKLNQLHYRTVEIFMTTLLLYYCFSQILRFLFEILEKRTSQHITKVQ